MPALAAINPRLIYCSITGYGQSGPKAQVAAHDLNYLAETGLLHLAAGADGAPVVPPALIADIAGGSYPAVLNILLALRERDASGPRLPSRHRDDRPPVPADVVGARPGFRREAAGRARAASCSPAARRGSRSTRPRTPASSPPHRSSSASGTRFAELIGLEPAYRDDRRDPAATKARVAAIIRGRDAAEWQARFAGADVCCTVVASLEEAVRDPHFVGRGLFAGALSDGAGRSIPALPVPLAPVFRETARRRLSCAGRRQRPAGRESRRSLMKF